MMPVIMTPQAQATTLTTDLGGHLPLAVTALGDPQTEIPRIAKDPFRHHAKPGAWRLNRQRTAGSSPMGLPSGPKRLP